MALFADASVWSSYQCNSGARLQFFGKVSQLHLHETLQGDDKITLECPLDDQAVSYLVKRRVVRITMSDADFSEWRIQSIQKLHSTSGNRCIVVAVSPLLDLADATVIRETSGSGIPSFSVGLVQVSPTEVIDDILLAQPEFQSGGAYDYFARGTVEPTTLFDIEFSKATPLALLRQVANAARNATTLQPAEIRVRRNGTTNYLIDVLAEIGSTATVTDLRSNKQILDHDYTTDATEQVSVVIPFGADDGLGDPSTVSRAAWTLGTPTGLVYPITDPDGGPSPVLEADQLNGMYVVPDANGALIQITDSAAGSPATVTLASSTGITAGRQYELRASASDELVVEVSSPSAIALYDRKVGTIDRPDLLGVRNLVRNPWFRTWTTPASAPDNWEFTSTVGSGALSQNTDPLYTQYGGKSVHFSSGGPSILALGTLRTEVFYPRPVLGAALYSYRVRVFPSAWNTNELITICLVSEAAPTIPLGQHTWISPNHTLTSGDAIAAGSWYDLGVEAIDLTSAAGGCRLEIRLQVGGTLLASGAGDIYIDAVQVVQSAKSSAFYYEYSGANALWHAGNLALSNNKDGIDAYAIDLIDRTRADGTTFPFEALVKGGTIRDTVPEQGINGQLLRVVGKDSNLLVPKDTSIQVATRQKLLSDLIGSRASVGGAFGPTVTVSGGGGGSSTGGGGTGTTTPPTTTTGSGGNNTGSTSGPSSSLLKEIIADPPGQVTTLENFPSALTDLGAEHHHFVNLTNVDRAFLTGTVVTLSAAGELREQYLRLSDATWRYLDGTGGPALSLAATGDIVGTSVVLETDARGQRWCRTVAINGNDTADPEVGHVALHGASAPVVVGGTGTGDWETLIQQLGGDAAVPFFYDGRFNVTLNAGEVEAIDDVRGVSGYGPQCLSATAADWPLYDAAEGTLQFRGTGGGRQTLVSAAFAGVDLANALSLVFVGRFVESPTSTSRRYYAAAVVQNLGGNYALSDNSIGVRMTSSAGGDTQKIAGETRVAAGALVYEESAVSPSTTAVRTVIVTQDGSTAQSVQVPDDAAESDTMTGAFSSASSYICMAGQGNWDFIFGGDRYQCDLLALFGVTHVLSAAEVAAVTAWAEAYRFGDRV
jgi:hypothetical protein